MSDNDVEVIDPPKKMGRPPGSGNKIRKIIIDAREACMEAGYNPFESVVAMAMNKDTDELLKLRCDFELMKYLQPTYQSVPFLGFDASGAAVAINMDAFMKPVVGLANPRTNGKSGNGRKP